MLNTTPMRSMGLLFYKGEVMASVVIDIGHGHIAVSYWSVTLNGLYMPSLNTKPDNGEYAVIDPKLQ